MAAGAVAAVAGVAAAKAPGGDSGEDQSTADAVAAPVVETTTVPAAAVETTPDLEPTPVEDELSPASPISADPGLGDDVQRPPLH